MNTHKNILYTIICFIVIILSINYNLKVSAKPKNNFSAPDLSSKIENILKRETCLIKGKKSIKVISLSKDDIIYEKNSKQLLIPASNQKLLTTAAALNRLHADYRFKTILATDGEIEGNKLKGNLYIKGYGDPKLVSERLWLISRELYHQGIRVIAGDLIADDSFFDQQRRIDSWPDKVSLRAYDASIGALSLNFNIVNLYLSPGEKGKKPRVILEPETNYFKINNQALTYKKKRGRASKHLSIIRKQTNNREEITLRGKIAAGTKKQHYFINISNPPLYLANVFKEFLNKEGITVQGKTLHRPDSFPGKQREIIRFDSPPLGLIIRYLNKLSNNFIAEQILKTLGAEIKGPPGTTKKGLAVVQEFLNELGIPVGSYVLKDGSGYSRENRLSADQIIRILKFMSRDFKARAEYVSSLAIMGIESLKHRGKNSKILRRARVKTGSLKGVSSLSGYLQTENAEELAFSIIINADCGYYTLKNTEDKIVLALIEINRQ